jgi:hypothetical protein
LTIIVMRGTSSQYFRNFSLMASIIGDRGESPEHPALVGCNGGSPPLVVISILYWELDGY